MRKYNVYYYLLFVLLIMGAFASMAQNLYGLYILGIVAIAFALLFGFQFYQSVTDKKITDRFITIESVALCVCAAIFALRIFYVHFVFVEYLFILAAIVLIGLYISRMIRSFVEISAENRALAYIVMTFHVAIICYLLSLLGFAISQSLAFAAGIVAFVFTVIFVVSGLLAGRFLIGGEKISALQRVTRFRDRSVLLLSLFFLFTLYTGLIRYNVLPPVYSEEWPQAYFRLVNQADADKKDGTAMRRQADEFKRNYDEFLKRNGGK